MPSIIVNEKDYTQGTTFNEVNTTVYVPILTGKNIAPTLYNIRSKSTFINDFKDGEKEANYYLVRKLIDLGASVLVEGIEELSVLGVVGSSDDYENTIWSKLEDKSLYQFRFLTAGAYLIDGFVHSTSDGPMVNPICTYMSQVATTRKDCIALLDCSNRVSSITDIPALEGSDFANKYCAGFAPWCTFERDSTIPTGEDSRGNVPTDPIELPGSSAYLFAFINSLSNNNPTYFAASGVQRGVIPYLVRPTVIFGDKDVAIAQPRTQSSVTYNLIVKDANYGYMVFGNRTLHPVGEGETQSDNLIASNFLNIRHLCIDIAKQCYLVSKKLQFEQLTSILWLNFTAGISPLLDKMLNGQGITNYKIIRVATNEKATLKAKIRVSPIEAVEDFDIEIQLTDTTSEVED